MFVTVFPPIVDALLAAIALSITAFWIGVFLLARLGRLLDRLAPRLPDPATLAGPSAPIGVLEEGVPQEVTP